MASGGDVAIAEGVTGITHARPAVVGVVGANGLFGRWLVGLFGAVCPDAEVLCVDASATDEEKKDFVTRCDVIVFSVPISVTPSVIREYTKLLAPDRPHVPLWMDVTSLKAPAVAAFIEAAPAIEAIGLHPMCAPPPVPSMAGRTLAVCEAVPLKRWAPWFEEFLNKVGGKRVDLDASRHDRLMSIIQAGCHAGWLAQAKMWSETVPDLGGLAQLLAVRTPSFALLEKAVARIMCGNPEMYASIQLENPEVPATLRRLAACMNELADDVAAGDRAAVIGKFFETPRTTLGVEQLQEGNADFERLSNLLADLDRAHPLVITIVHDRPGTLTNVLAEFATRGINLQSIQSVRAGSQLRFHICLDRPASDPAVQEVGRQLHDKGLIKLFESSLR